MIIPAKKPGYKPTSTNKGGISLIIGLTVAPRRNAIFLPAGISAAGNNADGIIFS